MKTAPDNPNSTVNPGDRVERPLELEEKANRSAINLEGEQVPAYFVVEGESGEQEALHHVEDAEEISDVIRQARTDENGNRTWW